MTGLRCLLALVAALSILLTAPRQAAAHSQSYGYLNVLLKENALEGKLEVAVRDLDTLLGLDSDGDGNITWGEFRSRETAVTEAVLARITIAAKGAECRLVGGPALTQPRGGETYLVFPFDGKCAGLDGPLEVGYRLLFDIDAQHRGLVNVISSTGSQNFVMTPSTQTVTLTPQGGGWANLVLTWLAHGIHHILIGYDHILFVITLLLGTVMRQKFGSIRALLADTAKVVTAFTLSHSITLALAAFGVIVVPVPLAESLIAATIALAAANNLWPLVTQRVWLVALVFGLIHGIGFANVLTDLGLQSSSLLASLLAFNIGVEIGQFIIVIVALPVIIFASRQKLGRYFMPVSNLAIIVVALLWFSDRAFNTKLMLTISASLL